MKKALSLFLAFVMIFGSFAGASNVIATATAETSEDNGFVYTVENGYAIITDYTNTEFTGQIEIPETIDGYTVKKIGREAFRGSLCTSVSIPSTVTEIHPEAFAYDMPNIEAYYGASSVYNTKNGILYQNIYGYNMLFAYPKNAPEKTYKIVSGGTVAGVGAFAFCEADNLEEFAITGYQYSAVDNYAFYGAKNLKKITLENCIAIGEKAFANCEKLDDVGIEIDQMLILFGSDAFENTAFTNDLSNYDTDGVLYYNNYLVTSLPEYDREYYAIKDGTIAVAGGAFDWDSLEEVSIPSSVFSMPVNPFYRCANLKIFDVGNTGIFKTDAYGVLMFGNTAVSYPNGKFLTCYVFNQVNEVASYAFYGSPVRNFYVPTEVELGNYALGGDSVTDIHYQGEIGNWDSVNHLDPGYGDLPNAAHSANVRYGSYSDEPHTVLTKTDVKATCTCGYEAEFEKTNGEYSENGFTYRIVDGKAEIVTCPSFVTGDLAIPEIIGGFVVSSIADGAFDLCKCTSVHIPSTVENIDSGSGLGDINTLNTIYVASANANYSSFEGVLYNKDLSVLLVYPNAKTSTEFVVPVSVETIVSRAFSGNYYLKKLSITENLKTIEADAFSSCSKLETLKILTDVEYIGDRAFRYCYRLQDVELNSGIGYIGKDVFQYTSLVENDASYNDTKLIIRNGCLLASKDVGGNGFMIPEGVTVIAEDVFKWKNIESVELPASLVTVGDGAFNGCPKLEEFYVVSGNKHFSTDEYGALYKDKTKLVAYPAGNRQACFVVPDGVTEIAPYALDFNDMLSNKYIPSSVKKIGKNGLGTNPDMTINYGGAMADFVQIDFSGDDDYKKFLINNVEKKFFSVSEGTHNNSQITVADPACTEKGAETIACECGYQHINEIPRNGHTPLKTAVVIQPATCTQRKISVRYCSVCGEVAETIYDWSLGHNYVKTEQDVGCDQAGGIFYECSRCGDSYSENYVEPHGHTVTDKTKKIDATCNDDGGLYKVCDTCGEAVGEPVEVYKATGHTQGEWKIESEVTCEEEGLEILTCTVCGETIDSRITEKPHHYIETVVEQTCTFKRTHFECEDCGDEYYSDKYFDTEHGELEEVIEEPGCFAPGKKYNRCTVCGVTVGEVESIPSTGHKMEVIDSREATCTQEGYEKSQCTKCSYTKTTVENKIAHTVGRWEYESNHTFTGICSACGTSFDRIKVYVTLDKKNVQTFSGMEETLNVTVTENLFDNIEFTSSDENVATVDADGVIKAVAPGKATITAKIGGTDISATCSVTVLAKAYLINWMVGEDVYIVTSVKEGESITPPEPPEMEDREFVHWSPEIPDVMPSHGLRFEAEFNIFTKSDKHDVSASYEKGCFDEDVTLDVNEIETEREPGGVYMVEGEYYDQIGLYNIKALNEKSDIVQPNDGYKVTIKIALPEEYKSRNSFVIYHRFVGGGREQLSTEKGTVKVENGYLIFEVSNFSEFEIYASTAYIKVVTPPAKTVYKYGQALDLTGIKITYTSDDGKVKTVTDTSLLTVKGYDSSKTGKQTVTVSYGQYSDTFDVEVRLTFWQWILRIFSLSFLFFG